MTAHKPARARMWAVVSPRARNMIKVGPKRKCQYWVYLCPEGSGYRVVPVDVIERTRRRK